METNDENERPDAEHNGEPRHESPVPSQPNEDREATADGFAQTTPWTNWIPIPKVFQSVEKEGPFTHCLLCDRELRKEGTLYLVEKIVRSDEVIIELAICFECRTSESEEGLSPESRESIEKFVRSRSSVMTRMFQMTLASNPIDDSLDPWLDRCLFDNVPMEGMRDYQLIALCNGENLQRDFWPAAISSQAMEELAESLSEKTKGWMDDFIGNNFGMPSEFCDPPKFSPVLF